MTGPAFVTGGSGFVGGAILRHLVGEGRDVRALARGEEAAQRIREAGAVPVLGDLFDPQTLLAGMRGCATLFHVAGRNATCERDQGAMLRTNADGSVQAVRAAAAAGIQRVVHTSSASTIGEMQGTVGREDSPHRGWFLSQYERSKFLAERRMMQLGRDLGLPVVCVNPSSVQGPGRTGGSARLLLEIVNRRRPPIVDTWLSVVDVDDCAAGHLLAERDGAPGERYLLNGASLTTGDALELLRSVCGRPRHVLRIPRPVATVVGAAAGAFGRLTRRDVPLCPEAIRSLLHGHRFDGSRAEAELGLEYRPIEQTIVRTLAWYAAQGLIPPLLTSEAAA